MEDVVALTTVVVLFGKASFWTSESVYDGAHNIDCSTDDPRCTVIVG